RRNIVNGAHALRILRGQRRDDRSPIYAQCSESLEIRLNAGTATRVRPADGDGDRGHAWPRRVSAPSTTASKFCAALAGSGASETGNTPATPPAPGEMTRGASRELTPEMAKRGYFGFGARIACTMVRKPPMPIGAVAFSFDVVSYTPPIAT